MIEYRNQHKTPPKFRRRRRKRDKESDIVDNVAAAQEEQEEMVTMPHFEGFDLLPNELKLHILTFVSEVSMDTSRRPSTLTHVLPLVSHEFYALSKSDCLWQPALEHLVEKEPSLWREGILKVMGSGDDDDDHDDENEENITDSSFDASVLSSHDLVLFANAKLNNPGYSRLFRMVVARFLRFTSPIFIMPDRRVQLGTPVALHFFEQRYRLLIQIVMEGYPREYTDGRPIATQTLPSFVYAFEPPFTRAVVVEVHRCMIDTNDGRANVLLMPVAFCRMEHVWERPSMFHLNFAQCIRLGTNSDNGDGSDDGDGRAVETTTRRQCMPCCIM